MALRVKRRLGYGKFRSLVGLAILVLQCAVVGYVDADIRQLRTVLRWTCDTRREDPTLEVHPRDPDSSSKSQHLFGFCTPIRGGQVDEEDGPTEDVGTFESDDPATSVLKASEKKAVIDYSKSPFTFTLFQDEDGSRDDPDGIPTRYLKMQNDRREQAKKALDTTLRWREANEIDTILARPNPKFDVCKKVFPHYFCGRDDTNHVILLQRPGLIDLPLAEANGLTGDDLLQHYIYEMEYLWRILEPSADGTMTSIIDLTGINLSILAKRELISIVQKFCSTMDAHFPQRSHKTLLINAPKWFGGVYKLISPLLRESTKEKIAIFSKGKKQKQALKELLVQCPISEKDDKLDIPPTEMEQGLRDFCLARLEEAGVTMQPVIS